MIKRILCKKTVTDDDGADGEVWVIWHNASPPSDAPWVGSRALAERMAVHD